MYHKVRITKLPGKARGGKINGNRIVPNQSLSFGGADMKSGPKDISVANTISAVPRDQANLEAEGGETVYGDINGDGMAEHLVIKGPRHSSGGVPLNLPDDTFIFSDTKSMKITDCKILSMFNKPCDKGGFTPATLAKQYDLSKYRKLLQDPESGELERKTAEIMIRNYTMKLGALALAQESKKGFPQGIPEVARPYMEANDIKDEDLIPELAQQQQQSSEEEGDEQGEEQNPQEEMMEAPQEEMMRYGGFAKLRRAEEGMEQQQQSATEQGGGNQMAQMAQQVGQALQQGAKPEKVVAELLQKQVPPEAIAQMLVQLGMPQEQVQQLVSSIAQQMQGAQQPPMAQYGYQMTSDTIPFNPGYMYPEHESYEQKPTNYSKGGFLPKKDKGGAPYSAEEAYTAKGVYRLNTYRIKYGLPPIGANGEEIDRADIKYAAGELQQAIIEKNPALVVDYIQTKSHQPSEQVKAVLKQKGITVKTNDDIVKALKDKKITADDITKGYKDNLWWYRAVDTQVIKLPKDEYEAQMKKPGAITQGTSIFYNEDPDNPEMYTEYKLEEPKKEDKKINLLTEEKEDEVIDRGTYDDVEFQTPQGVPPLEWSPQAYRSLGFGMKGKATRLRQYPWAPMVNLETAAPVYEDPREQLDAQTRAARINADVLGQFTGPQNFASNMSGIQGTEADQAAIAIANVHNNNIPRATDYGRYVANTNNQEQTINQGVAAKLYDETNRMNSMYRDEGLKWDEFNLGIRNQADKDAAGRYNLSAMTSEYDILPNGQRVFTGGKEAVPEAPGTSFDRLVRQYRSMGFSIDQSIAAAKAALTTSPSQQEVNMQAILDNTAYSKLGGATNMNYVMGSHVFPFNY